MNIPEALFGQQTFPQFMYELMGADLVAAAVGPAPEGRFPSTNLVYEGQEILAWEFGAV